jgi:hypothetical protein
VIVVLSGAIAGMPAAGADNKRLNDGVVANVYTSSTRPAVRTM